MIILVAIWLIIGFITAIPLTIQFKRIFELNTPYRIDSDDLVMVMFATFFGPINIIILLFIKFAFIVEFSTKFLSSNINKVLEKIYPDPDYNGRKVKEELK